MGNIISNAIKKAEEAAQEQHRHYLTLSVAALNTELLAAYNNNDILAFDRALKYGAKPLTLAAGGEPVLRACMAAKRGDFTEVIRYVKEHNVDVNSRAPLNANGFADSLLGIAALHGHTTLAILLVANGANIDQVQGDGVSDARYYAKIGIEQCSPSQRNKFKKLLDYFNNDIIAKDGSYAWIRDDVNTLNEKHFKSNPEFLQYINKVPEIKLPGITDISIANGTVYVELRKDSRNRYKLIVDIQNGPDRQNVLTETLSLHKDIKLPSSVGDLQLSLAADFELIVNDYKGLNPLNISVFGKLKIVRAESHSPIKLDAVGDITVTNKIVSGGPLQISSKSQLINSNAAIAAAGQINISAQLTNNSGGQIISEHGHIVVDSLQQSVEQNKGVIIAPDGSVFLLAKDKELVVTSSIEARSGVYADARSVVLKQDISCIDGSVQLNGITHVGLDANIKVHKQVVASALIVSQSIDKTIQANGNVYLLGKSYLLANGTIKSNAYICLLGDKTCNYTLTKFFARRMVEIKLTNPEHIKFPTNLIIEDGHVKEVPHKAIPSTISFEIIGDNKSSIIIPHNVAFKRGLRIKAKNNTLEIGDLNARAIITALSKILIDVESVNVINGGIYARKILSVSGVKTAKLGHIFREAKVAFGEKLPTLSSFLASDELVLFKGTQKIQIDSGEIVSPQGDFRIETADLQAVGCNVHVGKDFYCDVGQSNITVIYDSTNPLPNWTECAKHPTHHEHFRHERVVRSLQVKTHASIISVYGTAHMLFTSARIEGSQIYYGKLVGKSPTNIHTIQQTHDYQQRHLSGDKRHDNSTWHEETIRHSHVETFNSRVATQGDLDIAVKDSLWKMSGELIGSKLSVKFSKAQLGQFDANVRITPTKPQQIVKLFDDRPSFLWTMAADGSGAIMQATVPFRSLSLPEIEPIVLLPERRIVRGNSINLSKHYPAAKEIDSLFPMLLKMLGNVNFSSNDLKPFDVWQKLQKNTHAWLEANPIFSTVITQQDLESITQPMLIYVPTFKTSSSGLEHEFLEPTILCPKHFFNLHLLSNAGGLFARAIMAEGDSLELRGIIQAIEKKVQIKLKEELHLNKHKYEYLKTVTDSYVTRGGIGGSSCTTSTRIVRESEISPGAEIIGPDVDVEAKTLISHGGTIAATNGDANINIEELIKLDTADGVYYVRHDAAGKTFLKKAQVIEYLERKIVQTTMIRASGDINITSEHGDFIDVAAQFAAKNLKVVVKEGNRISECKLITEDQGTTFSKHRLMLTKTHTITQRGISGANIAESTIDQKAGQNMIMTGSAFMAKSTILTATKDLKLLTQILNHTVTSRTTGLLNPITYVNSSTHTTLQSAMRPEFIGQVELRSIDGDVEVQAAVVHKGEPESLFNVSADNGSINFTTAQLHTSSTTKSRTIGFSFNGSDAIAAALQGDTNTALKALASMPVLVRPIVGMAEKDAHFEDIMQMSMMLAYRTHDAYKQGTLSAKGIYTDFMQQLGFTPDATGKMSWDIKNINVSIGVTESISKEHSTQILSNVIHVWDAIFTAAHDITLHSVQAQGANLTASAGDNIHIIADQGHASSSQRTAGVKVSYGTSGYSVGVNYSKSNRSSATNFNSHFNFTGNMNLNAGRDIEISGAILRARDAYIHARKLLLETLFDEAHSSSMSASASTSGAASYSESESDAKWATEQTMIEVSNKLHIKTEEETFLKGSALKASDTGHIHIETPVLKHEHLHGYKTGDGFSVQVDKDKEQANFAGTMYDESQDQSLMASIIGKATVTNLTGEEINIAQLGINTDPNKTFIVEEEERSGLGVATRVKLENLTVDLKQQQPKVLAPVVEETYQDDSVAKEDAVHENSLSSDENNDSASPNNVAGIAALVGSGLRRRKKVKNNNKHEDLSQSQPDLKLRLIQKVQQLGVAAFDKTRKLKVFLYKVATNSDESVIVLNYYVGKVKHELHLAASAAMGLFKAQSDALMLNSALISGNRLEVERLLKERKQAVAETHDIVSQAYYAVRNSPVQTAISIPKHFINNIFHDMDEYVAGNIKASVFGQNLGSEIQGAKTLIHVSEAVAKYSGKGLKYLGSHATKHGVDAYYTINHELLKFRVGYKIADSLNSQPLIPVPNMLTLYQRHAKPAFVAPAPKQINSPATGPNHYKLTPKG